VFQQSGSKDFTNLAGSYAWAAFCEAQLGRMPEALSDYQIALPLLRQHAGASSILTRVHLGLYAYALHQSGHAKEAHALFDEALTTATLAAPTSAEFDNVGYRGMAYLAEGRPREALQTVNHFATNWLEFGKRFLPSGVQLSAHAHRRNSANRMQRAKRWHRLRNCPRSTVCVRKSPMSIRLPLLLSRCKRMTSRQHKPRS
jgi:tetratricopeptide (TPR) repeat protein